MLHSTDSPTPSQPDDPLMNKIGQTKEKVNEVVVIMQDNIAKTIERGENLEELETKTHNLAHIFNNNPRWFIAISIL